MQNVDTEGVDLTSRNMRIRLRDLTLLSQSSRERDAEAPLDDFLAVRGHHRDGCGIDCDPLAIVVLDIKSTSVHKQCPIYETE